MLLRSSSTTISTSINRIANPSRWDLDSKIRTTRMTIPIMQAKAAGARQARPLSSTPRTHDKAPTPAQQDTLKPLYASQSSLPHLPVPSLQSTFNKYLETLKPLLTPRQLDHSTSLVRGFLTSEQAQVLQGRLEERAREKDSWLSEWWNEVAYMGYRGRIVPNVSYFYIHKKGMGKGKSQEDRAAELVRAVVEFKKLVDSERLAPESVRKQPLCSASYKYLFNAVRMPTSPSDVPWVDSSHPGHIVVLRNNRYFKVDTEGRSASDLAKALKKVKEVADGAAPQLNLGVLTVDDRDIWTETRKKLVESSKVNADTIRTIDSAILLVCLDSGTPPQNEDERGWMYWSGGKDRSGKGKAFNRWFDKHQLIVDEGSDSGFNGEHSMLDGTPTLRMNEFMLASLEKGVIPLELPEAERNPKPMPEPEELRFELGEVKTVVEKSQRGFEDEMALQDLKMVHFTGYGKNTIKTYKISPDAWTQMIKQLAFFRLFKRPGVTYESCQTRKFLLGRTEVIRSTSEEAKLFCESMDSSSGASDVEREKRLRRAGERHLQYAAWAADGQGVDRHMFGLKMLVDAKKGEEVPEVFKDEAYGKSSHWEMSTSQLSTPYLDGWGYGEVVEDGYGLSYEINDDSIRWCVTTKNNNAAEFGEALCRAAEEIKAMMDRAKAAGEGGDKAKV